jgi:hypothetical protein
MRVPAQIAIPAIRLPMGHTSVLWEMEMATRSTRYAVLACSAILAITGFASMSTNASARGRPD